LDKKFNNNWRVFNIVPVGQFQKYSG
jgi:hypothetical protein